jgi:EAL domain-containing protein (putative c-di-GMP-specific phosphodiesterase class I)
MLTGFRRLPRELFASDLAEAIASNQLFLEYQPKFDCDLRQFTGVEALVRWRHPDHGLIGPSAFIPIVEESNLIHRLTDWVVRSAATQAALWQAGGRSLEIAINISAYDIDDLELPERLAQHCATAGIAPDCMILELTETGAMRQAVQMMDVLTRLRLKGFKLSIDDFGTGYSSLVQLQQLPFSEAKIDQSFVRRLLENRDCRAIVEITIELARRLGLRIVAEGVEDEPTLNSLIEIGCHFAQGFYLSRPVPAERIEAIIQDHSLLKLTAFS